MNARQYAGVSMLALSLQLSVVIGLHAQSMSAKQRQTAAAVSHTPPNPSPPKDVQAEGQRVFEQNCARCHETPDAFSQHITGTVVRHMRVRASLSEHDEQALLHFFGVE